MACNKIIHGFKKCCISNNLVGSNDIVNLHYITQKIILVMM